MFRCLALASWAIWLCAAASAQQIGVVASIDPRMTGTLPGASARVLGQGSGVALNDRIVSSSTGRGQLLFRDETTLSISPSSEIVLDAFVYAPGRKGGSIGIALARGALRFIGGRTTRSQPAQIRTPLGTIGIRGSSALVRHTGGRTIAVFLMGDQMCFTTASGRACTGRRGGVLGPEGYLGQISPASLAALLEQIDGPAPEALNRRGAPGSRIAERVAPQSAPVSTRGQRRTEVASAGQTGPDSPVADDDGLKGAAEIVEEFVRATGGGLTGTEFEDAFCRAFPGGGATGGVFPGRGRGGRNFDC